MSDPLAWKERANCRGCGPALFFPENGGDVSLPKAVCAACEVRAECLDYSLENGEHHGIWGGISERGRRGMRRRRRAA